MDRAAVLCCVFIASFFGRAAVDSHAAEELLQEPRVSQSAAAPRTSPFLTLAEERSLKQQGNTIPINYLEITAIFYSPEAIKSRAIIEGRVLSIGDTIDNKKIVTINTEDVVLKDSQAHYIVHLKKITPAASSSSRGRQDL